MIKTIYYSEIKMVWSENNNPKRSSFIGLDTTQCTNSYLEVYPSNET